MVNTLKGPQFALICSLGESVVYAIKIYFHPLCAIEWHIWIFCVYDRWGQWHTRDENNFRWHYREALDLKMV